MESGILGFGIRNTAQGVRDPTNYWNPKFKFHRQKLESSTWNPKSTAWSPESRLSWISLHGVILNTLKVLPTSFRVALVCNFPALCSLYASRVGFETVRIFIIICGYFRILVLQSC